MSFQIDSMEEVYISNKELYKNFFINDLNYIEELKKGGYEMLGGKIE